MIVPVTAGKPTIGGGSTTSNSRTTVLLISKSGRTGEAAGGEIVPSEMGAGMVVSTSAASNVDPMRIKIAERNLHDGWNIASAG